MALSRNGKTKVNRYMTNYINIKSGQGGGAVCSDVIQRGRNLAENWLKKLEMAFWRNAMHLPVT